MNAPKRQPRSVTATYGAVSATLLVVIATVALIVKPPSPPALAEFAPQAENTIEETADNQSSRFGSGGNGSCSAGQLGCEGIGVTTTTTIPLLSDGDRRTERTIPRKPGTRCVGDPPRQIDDHQSPPCANPWEGDNGGATAKGVTATEVRVAHWRAGKDHIEGLVHWFNTKFEFYGRSIRLVKPKLTPMQTPEQQRASADSAAEFQPFADVQIAPHEGMLAYRQRLADHRVISVTANDDFPSERDLSALHPYAWNYSLSYDKLATDLGEFACKGLAGRTARNAGPALAGEVRSFGVVTGDYQWNNPPRSPMTGDIGPAVDQLKRCKAPVTVRNTTFGAGNEGRLGPIMAEFKKDKVTTVIVAGPVQAATTETLRSAQDAGYEPEWLIPGGGGLEHFTEMQHATLSPANQTARVLTLNGTNKNLPRNDWPSTWAYDEAGVQVPQEDRHYRQNHDYQALLLLASGIQQAGPRLTPETFARGLQTTRFPNPGAGAAPFYQASVGFTGDHTMIDDEAVQWWSAAAPTRWLTTPYPGGWCNFRQGARWRRGAWPDGTLALFDPGRPCH